MSDKTGNEPELSGAKRKKQLADDIAAFEAYIDRLIERDKENNRPNPHTVTRGTSCFEKQFIDPLLSRLGEIEKRARENKDKDITGQEPGLGGGHD